MFRLILEGEAEAAAAAATMLRDALVRQGWPAETLRLSVQVVASGAALASSPAPLKPEPFVCECGPAAGAAATVR